MKVSVVICTYAMDRYDVFSDCVDSVLAQTYDPLEVVVLVDGNDAVFDRVRDDYGDLDDIVLHCNEENQESPTAGREVPNWPPATSSRLSTTTASPSPTGSRNSPGCTAKPTRLRLGPRETRLDHRQTGFLPEEFYWLVGCDERGMGEHMDELRNTYGSNISFRRDVFLNVGGYDENTGRKGDRHIQAHEAPVCIRMANAYGKG